MWLMDKRADIESDFSVFHRITNPEETLDGPTYFEFAERLPAYAGVLQARQLAEEQDKKKQQSNTGQTTEMGKPGRTSPGAAKTVTATRGVIENSSLAGLIEWD